VKDLAGLAPFVVIALLFWLLLIRPASRRNRELQQTQRSAEVGSEVMLTSGIFGVVSEAGDDTLQIEIAPGTTIKVARAAVARVIPEETEPDAEPDEPEAEPADEAPSTPGTDSE
jgi:preprotein translocase subunit YajC